MSNKLEYELSNVSFTNKDFFDVYPELLQLAKKLSGKWDPTVSNESDPGVVLIKELALITDKINYIADKYALENNPRSVTQVENARQLYNLLGYYPRWYESAKVNLSMYWNGEPEEDTYIKIPKYTGVQDADGEFVYTLLNDVVLSLDGKLASQTIEAIEGTYHRLIVNNNDIITLSMLSDDQRIYISNYNVAQNGIFITDSTGKVPWTQVNNINLVEAYTNAYSFNVDIVTGQCYIQFPKDIAYLIGDGLIIHYIVSKGQYGNIPISTLTKFVSSSITSSTTLGKDAGIERTIETGDIIITNTGSTYLGKDPEEIDDMYESWKKVAGTFDTLVTLRDYNNAARRYPDIASNAFVCDRTNDIQVSYKVISGTPSMPTTKIKIEKTVDPNTSQPVEKLKPYQLKLYALRSFPYLNIDRYEYYDSTFQLFPEIEIDELVDTTFRYLPNDKVNEAYTSTMQLIDAINTHQCISHSFAELEPDKIALLKNKYNINLQILANSDLSDLEIKEMKRNICKAIYTSFNSNKMHFGEKINYDDLLECIKNSDNRIKTAILDRLKYDTYAVYYKDVGYIQWIETPVGDSAIQDFDWEANYSEDWIRQDAQQKSEQFRLEILAKNILAGITPYIVDDGNGYPYGLNSYVELDDVEASHVQTNVIIPLHFKPNQLTQAITLGPNEVITFSSPNLLDIRTYGAYIYYEYVGPGIEAKQDHILTDAEKICFFYKEADDDTKYRFDLYGAGTIITPSFNLVDNDRNVMASTFGSNLPSEAGQCVSVYRSMSSVREYDGLSVSDNVVIKKINKILLGNPEDHIYFITNKIIEDEYLLEFDNQKRRVLGEGEFLIYTNATRTAFEILGAGTEIRWVSDTEPVTLKCPYVDEQKIAVYGSTALLDKWVTIKSPTLLEVVEKSFTNAREGSVVSFTIDGTTQDQDLIIDSSGIYSDDEYFDIDYSMQVLNGRQAYVNHTIEPQGHATTTRNLKENQMFFVGYMNEEKFDESIEKHLLLRGVKVRKDNEDPNVEINDIYAWKSVNAFLDQDTEDAIHWIYDIQTFLLLLGKPDGTIDPEKLDAYIEFLEIDGSILSIASTGYLTSISSMTGTPPNGPSSGAGSGTPYYLQGKTYTQLEKEIFLDWYTSYILSQGDFLYLQQFVEYNVDNNYPELIDKAKIDGRYSYVPGNTYFPLTEFSKITIDGVEVPRSSSLGITTECQAFLNLNTSKEEPQLIRYDSETGIIDQVFFFKTTDRNPPTNPIASLNGTVGGATNYLLYSSDALFVEGSPTPTKVTLLDDNLEEYNPTFFALRQIDSRVTSGTKLFTQIGKNYFINFPSTATGNQTLFKSKIKLPAGDYIIHVAHSNACLSDLKIKYGSIYLTKRGDDSASKTQLAEPGNYYLVFTSDGTESQFTVSWSLRNTAALTEASLRTKEYKYGEVFKLAEAVNNQYIKAEAGDFIIATKDKTNEFSWEDFGVTPVPLSSVCIAGLMKYTYFDPYDKNKGLKVDVDVQALDELIKALDYDYEFNYLYKVPEKKKIANPLLSESFFNVNHVYNWFTIPEAKVPEILA